MKTLRIIHYIPLLILISTFACESDADLVKAPPFVQKLVITAFISPSDKISYFRVTSNNKLYGEINREESPGLLSGSISDGENEVTLDTCKIGLKLDHEKMQIKNGKKYRLRVSSDKGLSAEAECTVPERKNFTIEVDTFSVLKDESPSGYYMGIYRVLNVKAKFSDIEGEDNYYRFFGTVRGYSKFSRISGYVGFDNEFISDKGMDGKSIIENLDEQSGYLLSMAKDSLFLKIYLFNTEKPYYQYHKSFFNYSESDNPFSEPTPMYSNITGGFGVFCSYAIDSLLLRLK